MGSNVGPVVAPAGTPAGQANGTDQNKARLKKAAQDFEAVFIGMMLKQMRKSMAGDNPIFGKSQESKIYQDMMDDTMATNMSKTGSFGLAKAMIQSVERSQPQYGSAVPTSTVQPIVPTLPDTDAGGRSVVDKKR